MMKSIGSVLAKTWLPVTKIGLLIGAALFLSINAQLACAAGWSRTAVISPALQPDSRGGSQQNDVAVNASGLTLAAWDQYSYTSGTPTTIGVAVQSGGRWGSPFIISGNATGYAMTPRVAVGADGTIAVSWVYQEYAGKPT